MSQTAAGEASGLNRELVERFESFLRRYYEEELNELAAGYPNDTSSVYLDWADLYRFDNALADDWLAHPEQVRGHAEQAVANFDTVVDVDLEDVAVRMCNLHETDTHGVADICSDFVGRCIGVSGQIGKVSQTYVHPLEAAFECQRCGTMTTVEQGRQRIQEPHECIGCERQGPFQLDYTNSEWVDRQMLRLTQPAEETQGGQGASIDVFLEGDAIAPLNSGKFKAGNHVTVTAEVRIDTNGEDDVTTYLWADNVHVEETDYTEIDIGDEDRERITRIGRGAEGDPYDLLTESVVPGHHGDEEIKLALVLQMFRGVRSQKPDGSWARGDSHILLIGDPGVGKSSLLRRVSSIAPRSTFASGKGASAAGMTAAAVPSDFGDEKWSVEAGALALADQGIAAVDEIDKVDEDAVSSLHDALESPQVVEVDKADIHATLPARASLLAAGNPEYGRFDKYEPIADQVDIDPTLLSRFDLMFILRDNPGEDEDRELASELVRGRQSAHRHDHAPNDGGDDADEPPLSESFVRKYVAHARRNVHPSIEDDAVADRLVELFVELRSNAYDGEAPVPVTVRKIQALQRLAEASARVRLSGEVTEADIERVSKLVLASMRDLGVDEDGQFDADVIETGTSKAQRDCIKAIKQALADMVGDHERGVPADELKGRLSTKEGFDPERVDKELAKLMGKGEVYEPNAGHYRPT